MKIMMNPKPPITSQQVLLLIIIRNYGPVLSGNFGEASDIGR